MRRRGRGTCGSTVTAKNRSPNPWALHNLRSTDGLSKNASLRNSISRLSRVNTSTFGRSKPAPRGVSEKRKLAEFAHSGVRPVAVELERVRWPVRWRGNAACDLRFSEVAEPEVCLPARGLHGVSVSVGASWGIPVMRCAMRYPRARLCHEVSARGAAADLRFPQVRQPCAARLACEVS